MARTLQAALECRNTIYHDLTEVLGNIPVADIWMTRESSWRLANDNNTRIAVPVHSKPSLAANIPLYTEEQMQAERARCFEIGRAAGLKEARGQEIKENP